MGPGAGSDRSQDPRVGRYLLGVTPLREATRFLRDQGADGRAPADLAARAEAAAAWRGRRGQPPRIEAAAPDPAWGPHLERVAARPLFQRQFGARRWRFATVPFGAVVSPQPFVHVSYARERAAAAPGESGALDLCLPALPETLELWGGVGEGPGDVPGATFYTRDMNVHVSSARLETSPHLQLTFAVTKTAVFVQVVRLGDRLVLKNGTHRALGLALRGAERLPCVLVDTDDPDDLPGILPQRVLLGAAPPLLTDFLDPTAYVEYGWRDRIKFIRLVPEEFVTPMPGDLAHPPSGGAGPHAPGSA